MSSITIGSKHHPADMLGRALSLISERGVAYGGIEQSFDRAAQIATLALNRPIHAYEVMIIMRSVKQARQATNPSHMDSHLDAINYEAFAATAAADYAQWLALERELQEAALERLQRAGPTENNTAG